MSSRPQPKVIPPPVAQKPEQKFGKKYLFYFQQHEKGNFGGLWEASSIQVDEKLEKILNAVEKKILTDADALTYVFENVQGELENDGF